MAFDNENCENNKFDECSKIDKGFFAKLNDLVQRVCDGACAFVNYQLQDGDVVEGVLAKVVNQDGCKTRLISIERETYPASMTIRGVVNQTGLGSYNLDELVFVEDPDDRLTNIDGGIRINKDGVYQVVPEITVSGQNNAYAHAAAYIGNALISDQYPNASTSTGNGNIPAALNAIQIVHQFFPAGTLLKCGMSIQGGNPTVNFANLTVNYIGI